MKKLLFFILFISFTDVCHADSKCVVKHPHEHGKHDHEDQAHGEHEDSDHTEISDKQAQSSGILTDKPQSRKIRTSTTLAGKIQPSEHKIAHIIPRFAGIVKEGRKHTGDLVQKGEVLAIVESNQSLQPFELRSQITGQITNGHLVPGEFVPENQWVYVVADLSEVWADLYLPVSEKLTVRQGQKLLIKSLSADQIIDADVDYIAPSIDEKTQAQLVRAIIPNAQQKFLPGMFITAELITAEEQVQVAVRKSALQNMQGKSVVFVKSANRYQPREVATGKSDDVWVEITEGLSAGDEYVADNSFIVKAEILKSAAEHDH